MAPALRSLGLFGAGVLVGAVAALAWPRPHAEVAPPPAAAPATPAAPRVVCTDVSRPRPTSTEEQSARLDWCEARLAAATAPRPTGRTDWPEGVPEGELPTGWPEKFANALQSCGFDLHVVSTDCEEYPCVTTLRGLPEAKDTKSLKDTLLGCPAVAEVFPKRDRMDVARTPVRCPDGSQQSAIVLSQNTDEGVTALFGTDEIDFAQFVIHGGRRAESALQLWDCAPGG